MNTLRFTLPFPPSVNHTWMRGSGKGLYANRLVKDFHANASVMIKSVIDGDLHQPLTQRLGVTVILHEKDKRRRDIDNYTKQLFDALTKNNVWLDDSQVDSLLITRGEINKEFPNAEVIIALLN